MLDVAAAAPIGGGTARVAVGAAGGTDGAGTASGPPSAALRASPYSTTEAKTGNPADAARARVDASGATIARRRLRDDASRARRRKLIRLVAIRDPAGRTRAMSTSSAVRIRDAAEVISSSMSR